MEAAKLPREADLSPAVGSDFHRPLESRPIRARSDSPRSRPRRSS